MATGKSKNTYVHFEILLTVSNATFQENISFHMLPSLYEVGIYIWDLLTGQYEI